MLASTSWPRGRSSIWTRASVRRVARRAWDCPSSGPRSSRTPIWVAPARCPARPRRGHCSPTGWDPRRDPGAEPMKTQIEWPIAFFDDDYLRIYKPMLTPDRTEKEVDFIASSLGLPKGARVLDLACGFGRHAIGMAERGYRVVGLDFNPNYLEIGEAQAHEAHVEVEWREGDMRRLPFTSEFDGVYSFFTSFGYFSDAENEDVLAGVGKALKPGSCFLLDLMNRDWLLTHPPQRTWTEREDGGLL